MSALELFRHQGVDIRVVMVDDEPWFVAADVCDFFGVTNRNRVMQQIDPEDKGGTRIDTPGGRQNVTTINESGLYSLLFALQPQQARGVRTELVEQRMEQVRRFKRWVTHDVLPTIRKTGRYGSDVDMLAALPSAKLLRMAADAAEAAEAAKQRAAELEAPAAAWNDLAAAEGDMLVSDAAKVLNRAGIVIGPQRLFTWLADNGWIFRRGGYWVAKQTAADAGLIAERITDYRHPSGERRLAAPQIRITAKGLERLHALMTANQIEAVADGGA